MKKVQTVQEYVLLFLLSSISSKRSLLIAVMCFEVFGEFYALRIYFQTNVTLPPHHHPLARTPWQMIPTGRREAGMSVE